MTLQFAGEGQAEWRYKAVVFDATGIATSEQARELYEFHIRSFVISTAAPAS